MKVVVAIDSLKGSLSSLEALVQGMNGKTHKMTVTGPLGQPVEGKYSIINETMTAIIEMSSAAGITLVKEEERNPLHTTTYGVGEMIKDDIWYSRVYEVHHSGCVFLQFNKKYYSLSHFSAIIYHNLL